MIRLRLSRRRLRVFDDADGDGQLDPDEPGLPGVAVIVENGPGQSHTVVTDAGGAYALYAAPDATVRVIPPAGYRAPGLASLPASRAGDFPLQADERSIAVKTASAATVTQSMLDFTGLALGVAGLGATVWIGLLAHRRALVRAFQAWALADLRLRHETERAFLPHPYPLACMAGEGVLVSVSRAGFGRLSRPGSGRGCRSSSS